MDRVRILTTGGTIEGYLDPSDENLEPLLPQLLKNARLRHSYKIEPVFAKDSRAITQADREQLVDAILKSEEDHILVSHGTITMCETASFIGEQNINKCIVFVGAMTPANENNSDAEFNLGAAIMALSLLKKGVHIAMNGKIFNYDNVMKNQETGYFEEIT